MIVKVKSIATNGLNSNLVEVEIDINNWLPSFSIVGLADQSVQESKERLRSALKSSWNKLPTSRITVNLAPASIKKSWPSFDLPIAVWVLLNRWDIINDLTKESIFLWELSLDWKLREIDSILPSTILAREKWFKRIFIPKKNALEASIIPDIDIIPVESLSELISVLNWEKDLKIQKKLDFTKHFEEEKKILEGRYDFKYILWQEHAKRALEIAAAGWHNIIMSGPPWSWKTMLAKSFAWILPNLTIEESIEVSKIYSISGLLNSKTPIVSKRPFRSIHHTASNISIIGWWRNAKPWEISLAHKWVLFLDEILEFEKSVLEVLRQPLEDWEITVNRVNATYNYPADFSLVWAMNPCPCWYLTDPWKQCICSKKQVENYKSRLSWPLLDRIDIFIEVPKIETEKLKVWNDYSQNVSSLELKQNIQKARNIQIERFKDKGISSNSQMSSENINNFCKLDLETEEILKKAVNNLDLSARAYFRILKLSRTIADLEWKERIERKHVLESLSFRKSEKD